MMSLPDFILDLKLLIILLIIPKINSQLSDDILGLVQFRLPVREFFLKLLLDHGNGLFTAKVNVEAKNVRKLTYSEPSLGKLSMASVVL